MGSGHTDYDHLVVTTQTCTSVVSGSNDMLPIELAELAVSGYGAWPGLHRARGYPQRADSA